MLYVIIPVHNRIQFTKDCLQCFREQTFTDFQVIIVDDGSSDGTSEMIKKEFPEVMLLKGDGNLWWTKAINLGLKYVLNNSNMHETDLVLTLNDDLLFKSNYLSTLITAYKVNMPCLVGSVVVDVKNPTYLEYAGTASNYYTAKAVRKASLFKYNYQNLSDKYSIIPTDELSGRGTLIPLYIFDTIGIYDEVNFPHYLADIELSVRARRKGYRLFVSVSSVIHSYLEATRNKNQGLLQFIEGFFSFKSPNYIKARYVFAIRHAPLKHIYFLLDVGRMFASFILRR